MFAGCDEEDEAEENMANNCKANPVLDFSSVPSFPFINKVLTIEDIIHKKIIIMAHNFLE